MFLLQQALPLAKGFPDQSCEVTEGVNVAWYKSCLRHVKWLGVNKTCSMVFPTPCEVARCEWDHGVALELW
jgi:hypothetical protein